MSRGRAGRAGRTAQAAHAIRAALVALCLSAGAVPGARAAAAEPCWLDGVGHEVLCGSVRRPLDPARPGGTQIDVHYAVLPALARNKQPDAVFFFAGGPGQSAIDLAGPVAAMLARVSNRRDVVLVDQRGTGRSAPLDCEADDPALPLAEQFDVARQQQRLAQCRVRLERLPHGDLRQYTTSIAMEDADAVRAALGLERIDLVGASYGTRAVIEYQRRFPDRVRRAVIDGVAPPDMALPATFGIDNQAVLDAWLAACADETACRARHPDLRARWQALLASLPRPVSLVHPTTGRRESLVLTRELLLGLVRGPLYAPVLASALPQAIDEAAGGRFEALAALAQSLGGRKGVRLAAGMHFSVMCSEDVPLLEARPAARPAARDFGDGFATLYREACAGWPRSAVPPAFYELQPARTATLTLSGGLDPATPPRHGERVARALGPKARHVVVAHAGHGVLGLGCMGDVLFRFIDAPGDDEALAVDAGCASGVPRPAVFEPPLLPEVAGAPPR